MLRVMVLAVKLVSYFFNMPLVVENANTDLPPIGFCIEPILGSKYDGADTRLPNKKPQTHQPIRTLTKSTNSPTNFR